MLKPIPSTLPLLLCFSFGSAVGQNGALDVSFNVTGWQFASGFQMEMLGGDVAVQPDGGVVATGQAITPGGTELVLVRFLANGEFDTSFNGSGLVVTDLGQQETDEGQAIALQPDGKILVSGRCGSRMALVRYLGDGTPDSTFGENGVVLAPTNGMRSGEAMALQGDGRIVVGGRYSTNSLSYDAAIARFTADGVPDSTFDADGIRTIDAASDHEFVYGIAVQPDGRILLGGTVDVDPDSDDHEFLAARVNADGSTDDTFGDGGVVSTVLGPGSDWGRSLTLLPDGRFVIAGWKETTFQRDIAVVRYQADGSPDPTFGDNGTVVVTTVADEAWAVGSAMLPNGKLLVLGTSQDEGSPMGIAVLQFDEEGVLDPTWDGDGIVHTSIQPPDQGSAITIQPDGRVLVVGTSLGYILIVVRYLNDLNVGTLEPGTAASSTFVYPNPLPETARFSYALTTGALVSLQVLDAEGRVVRNILSHETRSAGSHEELLDFTGLAVGNYTLVLQSDAYTVSVKMVKQ